METMAEQKPILHYIQSTPPNQTYLPRRFVLGAIALAWAVAIAAGIVSAIALRFLSMTPSMTIAVVTNVVAAIIFRMELRTAIRLRFLRRMSVQWQLRLIGLNQCVAFCTEAWVVLHWWPPR
jgi:hypothetical protein